MNAPDRVENYLEAVVFTHSQNAWNDPITFPYQMSHVAHFQVGIICYIQESILSPHVLQSTTTHLPHWLDTQLQQTKNIRHTSAVQEFIRHPLDDFMAYTEAREYRGKNPPGHPITITASTTVEEVSVPHPKPTRALHPPVDASFHQAGKPSAEAATLTLGNDG